MKKWLLHPVLAVFALIGLLLVLSSFFFLPYQKTIDETLESEHLFSLVDGSLHKFQLGDSEFTFEVVNTPASKTKGLSGRGKIGSDGMLFVFDQSDLHGIWMKDMEFDLDLIWVADEEVVDITSKILAPQDESGHFDLPIYRPSIPSKIVIEVEAGFVESNQVELGQQLLYLRSEGGG